MKKLIKRIKEKNILINIVKTQKQYKETEIILNVNIVVNKYNMVKKLGI